jgi:hypothetical protein
MRSKSLLKLASKPLARSKSLLEPASESLARSISLLLQSHYARKITAQACFKATVRSKSLLKLASKPWCA